MSLSDLLSPSALRIWVGFRPHLSISKEQDVPVAGTPPTSARRRMCLRLGHHLLSREEDVPEAETTPISPRRRMCVRIEPHLPLPGTGCV
jgi:hypothetical protein